MAASWAVVPGAMAGLAGETAIDVSVAGVPPTIPPPPPEHAESIVASKRIILTDTDFCSMTHSL